MLVTYFDQDYDIISEHPDEILAAFKREAPQEHVRDVVADTRRFIADFGESDEKLSTTFKSLFNPDAGFEGWEGRTTREWLLRMIDIFSE
jgi:hypothetical protein